MGVFVLVGFTWVTSTYSFLDRCSESLFTANGLWLLFRSDLHLRQSTGVTSRQLLPVLPPSQTEGKLLPQINSAPVTCLSTVLGAMCSRARYLCAVCLNECGLPLDGTRSSSCEMESVQWLWTPGWSVYGTPAWFPMSGKIAPSWNVLSTFCYLYSLTCMAAVWISGWVSELSLEEVSSWNTYQYILRH